jgi:hypothetical protein
MEMEPKHYPKKKRIACKTNWPVRRYEGGIPLRRLFAPVLATCLCLAALFSVAVVRAENDLSIEVPNTGAIVWSGLEPPFAVPPENAQLVRVKGTSMRWKGYLSAQCSEIRSSGGNILSNDRLVYSFSGGPYTPFSAQADGFGRICEVPKNEFAVDLQLALSLQNSDAPGLYTAVVTFEYRSVNNNAVVIVQLDIEILISEWAEVSITPNPVSLFNLGLPDLEVHGQAQVEVTSLVDWELQISCSADFSSGTAVILPNQIQFSTDQVNWKPLTAGPQWSLVWSGTGNMTLTLYFKMGSFLPFEAGLYTGLIALRAVPGPG